MVAAIVRGLVMRRLKVFGLVFVSVLVVGVVTAGAAFAESLPLPLIHTALPGELYPIDLGGHLSTTITLRNSSGGVLTAGEVSVLLSALELTALGLAIIDFLGLLEVASKEKCHTLGDSEANGAVLFPGAEYHLVYTGLSGLGEQLEVAGLVLFDKFTIFCSTNLVEYAITGPATTRVSLTKGTETEGDANDIETAWRCGSLTSGLQEIPYYYTDSSQRVATTLLWNVSGVGNAPFCVLIEGTVLLTPETGSAATMFTILS